MTDGDIENAQSLKILWWKIEKSIKGACKINLVMRGWRNLSSILKRKSVFSTWWMLIGSWQEPRMKTVKAHFPNALFPDFIYDSIVPCKVQTTLSFRLFLLPAKMTSRVKTNEKLLLSRDIKAIYNFFIMMAPEKGFRNGRKESSLKLRNQMNFKIVRSGLSMMCWLMLRLSIVEHYSF